MLGAAWRCTRVTLIIYDQRALGYWATHFRLHRPALQASPPPHLTTSKMCNMVTMQTFLPSFVQDPATVSVSAKLLSLSTLNIAVQRQHSSERYLHQADGVSFQSEAFRLRTQTKISELVRTATASTEGCSSTNALLAKKALKYRRVLERHQFASAATTAAVPC
ncbi:hypothetical protein PC129_g14599 [Phytophthora cactorum]|nr:hypothetical protein Pcac1_g24346 [Phytophthora cactorum]KAG2889736.1 hypothetical protein PC114_g17812 [Phytophthora cactorum]KAG2917841.1 hypothetical protein PC117_g17263 [Phytophthora cactorum]KAG2999543.1 hypothetical protein PC119_g17188 [Phytophthora cactorum]KAG3145866.1 hypothetical protein C6341_g18226 [Phytophthora cactorum]